MAGPRNQLSLTEHRQRRQWATKFVDVTVALEEKRLWLKKTEKQVEMLKGDSEQPHSPQNKNFSARDAEEAPRELAKRQLLGPLLRRF